MINLPRIYLGTMTYGWSQASSVVDESVATAMTRKFLEEETKHGEDTVYVDTARIYAGGKTERYVGTVMGRLQTNVPDLFRHITVGTKAHPSQPGGLSPDGIRGQLTESLSSMKMSGVGEYYLHQPDTEHSLLDSLRTAHELKEEGKIEVVGMSNYHVSEMERAFALCEEHGLTKPTVFQGLYNPLNRLVESELLPVLRKNDCAFVAYNPLAAGLLAGKHDRSGDVKKGRFRNNQNYLPRFYTDKNFDAIDNIRAKCDEAGISMVEATFRWLLCHSALKEGDGVLLGASSMDQLAANLSACAIARSEEGDLPEPVLQAMNDAWATTEDGAFPYWRSYSSDMPQRESLDQGASYSAVKK